MMHTNVDLSLQVKAVTTVHVEIGLGSVGVNLAVQHSQLDHTVCLNVGINPSFAI